MPKKCPGQMSPRDLDSVMVSCPDCGRMVECCTDERKRRCKCGKLLLREGLPRCAEWCLAAEQCLGEAVDIRELRARVMKVKNDPRAKKCFETIQQMLKGKSRDDKPE